jgi:predicted RND superfamily exporter protein
MRKFLKIPWVVIGLVLLVTGFLSYQIFANIRLDNDVTRFIPEENPARVAMSEVDDLFGSQMTMLVGLESTDGPIFTPEKLGAIREVTEKLERVVNVNEVTSLMNTDYILSETIGDEEVIEVQSLVPEDFGGSLAEIQEIKRRILSWDLYHRSIVSDDYTSTQIILELEEIQAKEGEEDPKRLSYDGITRVLTETDLHGMKYYLAGTPAMSALMSKNMTADLSFLIPLGGGDCDWGSVLLFPALSGDHPTPLDGHHFYHLDHWVYGHLWGDPDHDRDHHTGADDRRGLRLWYPRHLPLSG